MLLKCEDPVRKIVRSFTDMIMLLDCSLCEVLEETRESWKTCMLINQLNVES